MSEEFLVINTEQSLVKPKALEPLPLYDENYSMLKQKMPDYTGQLPNQNMTNLIGVS